MFIRKNFGLLQILRFSAGHFVWLFLWSIIVVVVYKITDWSWLAIPWLPISVIGVAVAFYVGFKNNSAYDRLWEARKIWGGIVNSSRTWGANVKAYIGNHFTATDVEEAKLFSEKKRLIYRHISWLYILRCQLLVPTPWEHVSQGRMMKKITKKRIEKTGAGLFDDEFTQKELKAFLPADEYVELIGYENTATQIIDKQSQDLAKLREEDLIDDFRHMELQKILNSFYDFQGKCERIKKFPFPRQYGSMSFLFIAIFIFLLPFGVISEFEKLGDYGIWMAIPFTVLISWVFLMMELVGDYSENPFEGLGNDIPMLSLCRTIEIDLLQMLGEKNTPSQIKPNKDILM